MNSKTSADRGCKVFPVARVRHSAGRAVSAGYMSLTLVMGVAFMTAPVCLADSADVAHPVMDYGVDTAHPDRYERAAAAIMDMSDEDMLGLVPPFGYTSFCECPACYGGAEGRGVFLWTIENPDRLQCRYCDEVVVPNANYPEAERLEGVNALGESVSFSYYVQPETKAPHFFSLHLWMHKRKWLLEQSQALARAYVATGDEAYARKAALVLDRFAQVYPHYPALHNRNSRGIRFCDSQEPPFNWDAGRWGYFHNEIPKSIIAIYDMIYESKALDALSDRRGYDVRKRLEDDFLRETYRIAAASPYHVGNIVGYDVAGVAILGRVINEPDAVHQAFGWMMDNVEQGFFRDGLWHESPSYHYMTVGGLKRAFSVLEGYSDPPGYTYRATGERLDAFAIGESLPFFSKAMNAPEVLDFPNGCSTPVHDTWPGQRRSAPRDKTRSTIAPAFGHASLGRGTGASQMQAQLHFSGTYGHHHLDALNLTLFAKEKEMLSDLGYTWTQMRSWNTSTLGHNTVVVNRNNQRGGRHVDGRLLRYVPELDGVSLVEAAAPSVYPDLEGPDAYRRLLLLVPVSTSDAYVVDVFRVSGGTMHDWSLHGDADTDTTALCSLDLAAARDSMLEPGESWHRPETARDRVNPYGMIRNVRAGATDDLFITQFAYAEDVPAGIRVHLAAGDCDVFLGTAPSVRRTGIGSAADMRKAFDYWMPQLLVRRQGDAPLTSTFAAVHEPYVGTAFLDAVRRLPVDGDESTVALEIVHEAGIDTVVVRAGRHGDHTETVVDDITLQGYCGIVRQSADRHSVTGLYLVEGQRLSCRGVTIEATQAQYSGQIRATRRQLDGDGLDAFVVDCPLPLGDALAGSWLIVTYPNGWSDGHPIDHVTEHGKETHVVLAADHGLRMQDRVTTEVYFPQRTYEGPLSFRIPLATSLQRAQNAERRGAGGD